MTVRDELYEILLCEAMVGQQGIELAINLWHKREKSKTTSFISSQS